MMAAARKLMGLCLAIALVWLIVAEMPRPLAVAPDLALTTITGSKLTLKPCAANLSL